MTKRPFGAAFDYLHTVASQRYQREIDGCDLLGLSFSSSVRRLQRPAPASRRTPSPWSWHECPSPAHRQRPPPPTHPQPGLRWRPTRPPPATSIPPWSKKAIEW